MSSISFVNVKASLAKYLDRRDKEVRDSKRPLYSRSATSTIWDDLRRRDPGPEIEQALNRLIDANFPS